MFELEQKRSNRVAQLIQEELAKMLVNDIKDPRVGFVTVTEVRLADDLRNGKVFVSIYGSPEERAQSLEGLEKAAGFLRRELSHRLKLRYCPELIFVADESLDRAQRLQELMSAVARGEIETPDAMPIAPVQVDTPRSAMAHKRQEIEQQQAASQKQTPQKKSRSSQQRKRKRFSSSKA